MITVVIVALIFAGIGYLLLKKEGNREMGLVLGTFIGAVLGCIIASFIPIETTFVRSFTHLENLQDNNSSSGNFVLGCGNIEGSMQYAYYVKENGYYILKTIDCKKVKINLVSSNIATLIKDEYVYTNSIINLFSIKSIKTEVQYTIEIPQGSIKNDYNLDAK